MFLSVTLSGMPHSVTVTLQDEDDVGLFYAVEITEVFQCRATNDNPDGYDNRIIHQEFYSSMELAIQAIEDHTEGSMLAHGLDEVLLETLQDLRNIQGKKVARLSAWKQKIESIEKHQQFVAQVEADHGKL